MYTATQQQTTLERRQALLDRQSDLASTITDNEGKLRSIETEKKKLFRSIASGDRTATERADRLDVQELDLQRTLAGFRSELADVDGDLAALVPILQAENARESNKLSKRAQRNSGARSSSTVTTMLLAIARCVANASSLRSCSGAFPSTPF